ncbi:Txe/YoeB family addiction module toxin [Chryseobacterium sp. 6424]|uniref:Txe/YoeB family addiction module toxin n=1 Tax=Chryseobacterium sp. 6424 TaxID=2039166 RepID=UPI000EFAB2DC|nr:Txe/YoeB family addiction module toxin [Chryseobacterium sp. 6424]AYO58350.1 Txe/YoeB family addiction module toxin [Chryseobacterium sp. 6424]
MKYIIKISEQAEKDILKLEKSGEKAALKKLLSIIKELESNPTVGIGKPERLKHFEEITYSRRISAKHRHVYEIQELQVVVILISAYGHYNDK